MLYNGGIADGAKPARERRRRQSEVVGYSRSFGAFEFAREVRHVAAPWRTIGHLDNFRLTSARGEGRVLSAEVEGER